ncbi:MAG TPA: hypothetical protein VGG01_23080 [Xanthobacteraceae bacterium]|jgi:hypothetical protein
MAEFLFLMHDDATTDEVGSWEDYIEKLQEEDAFEGGSVVGDGICVRQNGETPPITAHLVGYIRVSASSIEQAQSLLAGNPHFEAGGTVEIRELPHTE